MTDTSVISPRVAFHYVDVDCPMSSHDFTNARVAIRCVLERGAEAYYSGLRAVIFTRKIRNDDDSANAEIQTHHPPAGEDQVAGEPVTIESPEDKDEGIDVDAPPNGDLPLCTLYFELVSSNETSYGAEIRLARTETSTRGPVQIPDTHRILCERSKRTTAHSPSCVLVLATRPGVRYRLGTALQHPENALTILKSTPNTKRLSVTGMSAVLAARFVEAFSAMAELESFTQRSGNASMVNDDEGAGKTYLNAAQLTTCFAHWPKLRQATVYRFGEPLAQDGHEFAPAQCALDQIRFEHGIVSMAQLRAMTASSQDTLHSVALKSIKGISNKELTSWLFDFGPNLTSLELEFKSNDFTLSQAEELALDATIHRMPKLLDLKIKGPVATVLTLLRFEPGPSQYTGRRGIQIRDPRLFDPRAFITALRTTKWENVDVTGLTMSEENSEVAEANRVAKERGIYLWM